VTEKGNDRQRVSVPSGTSFLISDGAPAVLSILLVFLASFQSISSPPPLQEASNCGQVFEKYYIPNLSVMNFEE